MVSTAKENMAVRPRTTVSSLIDLCEAGRYRDAEDLASRSVVESSQDVLALGILETHRRDLNAAKDRLSPLAFSDDPLADRAKVQLAVAYWYGGEHAEAKDLLGEVGDSFEKFLLKAIVEEERPRYSLRFLDKAAKFEVRPGMEARLHNCRAIAHRRLKNYDKAIQEYEATLYFLEQDHSDNQGLARANLAHLYRELNDLDQAEAYIERAIEELQDDPPHLAQAFDEKARIFLAKGENKRAKEFSLKAISLLRKSDRKEWLVNSLLTYADLLRRENDSREFGVLQEAEDVSNYLQRSDLLIGILQRRYELATEVARQAEKNLVRAALASSDGTYRGAAKKLSTTHPRVMRLVRRHNLDKNL